MTIIDKIKDLLRMLAENIHKRRRVVLALSCVVVFVTTYMLILPAFTLEKTKAAEQGGIDVPGITATSEDTSSDTDTGNDDSVIVENKDNESDGQKNDTASSSDSSSAGKTESNNSKTTESKTDIATNNETTDNKSTETITEKEAMAIAMRAKDNTAGVFEEEVTVSSSPSTGRRMLKASKGGLLRSAGNDDDAANGVWDLANTQNTQFLHVSTDSSVTQNEQDRDAAFKLTFSYSLKEDVVRAIDAYDGHPKLVYDLSDFVANSPVDLKEIHNGVISIGTRKLGTYKLEGNKVILEFTDTSYFDGRTTFTGFFNLTAETDESRLGNNDEWTYTFPGTSDTVPIRYKKTVEEGSKSVYSTKNADGSYTLHYTANINVNSDLDSMTFNDVLGGLQTLDASSVKINGNSVLVSQSGQNFSFDVANALGTTGVAKGSYQVTYDTKVTEAQLKAMTADKTTETNKATWKVNGDKDVPGGETKIEIDKPHDPIPVTKTVDKTSAQPGDTLTYSVTYGDANTDLSGFKIADYITDVVVPQGTNVTLNYGNGQSVQVPFSSQSTDSSYSKGSVTLFDYTFPEGTTGKGPVTVTYSVKLIDAATAKANNVYDTTSVNNLAQEHRYNTQDNKTTTVPYEKEPHYTVSKTETSVKTDDGKWAPGAEISYTLTIGDANTDMSGVNIKDVMTDLQTLQGDVMIKVGNGSQMTLSNYVSGAIKWTDDGNYSQNDVELFNFNMPANAGNGPVVITYTTKVISQEQADAAGIYGDKEIKNTGTGGKQSDGTTGIGEFEEFPSSKRVTVDGVNVNEETLTPGSTVHYTLTYGDATKNLSNAVIMDEMTDMQKLVGNVTITKPDGSTVTMPTASGQWAEDGVVWTFLDDGVYSTSLVRVFRYRLPNDFGNGPIIIEYDAQIISAAEAKESGIGNTQNIYNKFDKNQTVIYVEYPREYQHNPKVTKEFNDKWDVDNNTLYWDIIVEKDDDSAYPIENVSVREFWDESGITIKNEKIGVYYYKVDSAEDFDLIKAIVTTDDGTQLTPGVDYTIDKESGKFTFPVLNERVHISLPFHSPVQISDGFEMHNVVQLNNNTRDDATAIYSNNNIEIIKNGAYSETSRIIGWEVQLNPSALEFTDSDPLRVWFTDKIPSGLTLLNIEDFTENNPSIRVSYPGKGYNFTLPVQVNSNNEIVNVDIAAHNAWGSGEFGLNGNKIVVNYWTKVSDEEWERITSSASGSETFENHVTITAGDDQEFTATDKVTITSDEYLIKTDETKEDTHNVVINDAGDPSKEISYKVEINPHGYTLNENNPLTLTDYIATNMDLNPESVKVVNENGEDVTSTLAISYNDDSRLLSIRNIPDKTHLTLTYHCYARSQGEDTFTNTATLIGGGSHSSTITDKHNIQTNDAGVKVDGIDMNLHKIDENNISKNLAGAEFQLYECELEIGDLTNPETYNQDYWDDLLAMMDRITAGNGTEEEIAQVKAQFKIKNYNPIGDPAVSGETGFTQFTGLNEHKLYAWKEVKTPVDGDTTYTASDEYHYFVGYQHIDVNTDQIPQPLLPDAEQTNRKHAAWALDDACQLANSIRVASMANLTTWTATNIESEYTSIPATKEWEGDSDNLFETRPVDGIKLQLVRINADGTRENVGTPVAINVDDQGNWPTYIWNQLPAKDSSGRELKYTVVEEKVEDYSTTYSDEGNGITSGEIIVKNKLIPKSTNISVQKVFETSDTNKPEEIIVKLMRIKTDKNGVASEPEEVGETRLTASNNWKYTFTKLDTKGVEKDSEGKDAPYTYTYTVVEDTAALAHQGFYYKVEYSDGGKGVIEATEEDPLVITNSDTDLKFTKEWVAGDGSGTTEWPAEQPITVTLHRKAGATVDTAYEYSYTMTRHVSDSGEESFTIEKDDADAPDISRVGNEAYTFKTGALAPVNTSGQEYTYYVTEEADGYQTSYKGTGDDFAVDGGTIINTPEDAVELPHTGGIGTVIFYVLGSILVIGGGIYFISRRRAMK